MPLRLGLVKRVKSGQVSGYFVVNVSDFSSGGSGIQPFHRNPAKSGSDQIDPGEDCIWNEIFHPRR